MEMSFVINILGVTERTLQRRQTEKVLTKEESDRVVRLAKLYESTAKVLGDPGEARAWLHHASIALGNRTPLEMMDNVMGRAEFMRCSAASNKAFTADAVYRLNPKKHSATPYSGLGAASDPGRWNLSGTPLAPNNSVPIG